MPHQASVHHNSLRLRSLERRQRMSAADNHKIRQSFLVREAVKFKQLTLLYKVILTMGILVTVAGIGITYSYFSANKYEIARVDEVINTAVPIDNSASEDNQNGGDGALVTDDGTVIPSVSKPSRAAVLAYTASADMPKRIEINGIEVFARLTTVGDNISGEVSVPINVYNASWYTHSSEIGSQNGSSVVVGHIGFRSVEGVFRDIDRLKSGDIIKITMGDDRLFTYIVTNTETVPTNSFSMSKYLSFENQTIPRLHLITCSGAIVEGTTDYSSRFVVSAKLQS